MICWLVSISYSKIEHHKKKRHNVLVMIQPNYDKSMSQQSSMNVVCFSTLPTLRDTVVLEKHMEQIVRNDSVDLAMKCSQQNCQTMLKK